MPDDREDLGTQLQIKLYITKSIYNINCTYPISDNLYIPEFRLICTNPNLDKFYGRFNLYGSDFINIPFCLYL